MSESARKICVIGLGYVGLPVAVAFSRKQKVIGFDINPARINELKSGFDKTNEVEQISLKSDNLHFTCNSNEIADCDFYIVTVPTPVDEYNVPDLGAIKKASAEVAKNVKDGDIIVYESTVYPGVTEEVCQPIIEQISGLKLGQFGLGYSPERINPGDKKHRLENVTKIVAGSDAKTTDIVAEVYSSVVEVGVYRCSSIKVAEAAKVIENTQRDINIALMNELAIICHKLGINTMEVLEAAATKWNFIKFTPGLVGGHCIGVDPYYLTHKAEEFGYHPEIILSGRRVNDGIPSFIAAEMAKTILKHGKNAENVVILGVTFKENVPDYRNSKVIDLIEELGEYGINPKIADPIANAAELNAEHGIALTPLDEIAGAEIVILAVSHQQFVEKGWDLLRKISAKKGVIVFDIKSSLPKENLPDFVDYVWQL